MLQRSSLTRTQAKACHFKLVCRSPPGRVTEFVEQRLASFRSRQWSAVAARSEQASLRAASRRSLELIVKSLGVFEIARVEAFGEPVVDFGERRTRFVTTALRGEQPSKASRRA
jgi:hypothetical protein